MHPLPTPDKPAHCSPCGGEGQALASPSRPVPSPSPSLWSSRFSFPSSLGLTQPQPYHPQASPWAGSMAPPTRGDGGSPEVPQPGRNKTGAGEAHAQGEVSPALLLWLHLVLRTIVCTGWGERGGEGRR